MLPGRIGELARVAVLTRQAAAAARALWATLVGTVFAHRVFDLVPVVLLVLCVLVTAKIPAWAFTSLVVVLGDRVGLFIFAFASARHHGHARGSTGWERCGAIVTMARQASA